jgi:hypothetical protein
MANSYDVFKDTQFSNLLNKIDTIIKDAHIQQIDQEKPDSQIQDYIQNSTQTEQFKQLFENIFPDGPRLSRYAIYDELFKIVQLIKRILKVYITNILQKDLISDKILLNKEIDTDIMAKNKISEFKKYFNEIVKYYKLENFARTIIIPWFLRYGDCFIEIVDLQKTYINIPHYSNSHLNIKKDNLNLVTELKSKNYSLITDHLYNQLIFEDVEEEKELKTKQQSDVRKSLQKKVKKVSIVKDESKFKLDYDLNRFTLQYIKPHNIIILQSKLKNMIIGYLYIDVIKNNTKTLSNDQQMMNVINSLGKSTKTEQDKIFKNLSAKIIKEILLKANINNKFEELKLNNPDISLRELNIKYDEILFGLIDNELYFLLKELLLNTDNTYNKIKVRFIQTTHLIHFCNPSTEHIPFGESIIDPLVFPGKIYLITQLANIVMKMSRASTIRKWTIETGPKDLHSGLIQKLKKEFRNQRITSDELMSFKTVPRTLSDFKDLILLSKKGQKFIDVDIQALADPNIKIADLEDARNEIISLSGVPPSYLGQDTSGELRESLVNTNIAFATDISFIQNIITSGIDEICDKILLISEHDFKMTSYIKTSLTPPVSLMLQLLESTLSSIGNIFSVFDNIKGLKYDPYMILEKYIPYFDWEVFKERGLDFHETLNLIKDQGSQEENPYG